MAPVTSKQEAAQVFGAQLTAWVDGLVRPHDVDIDNATPEQREEALARVVSLLLPLHVVPGGKP